MNKCISYHIILGEFLVPHFVESSNTKMSGQEYLVTEQSYIQHGIQLITSFAYLFMMEEIDIF